MKQIVNLNFRLEINEPNRNIPNPVDVCEFLNQLLRTKDPLQYGKVIGYNLKFDDIVPYSGDWKMNPISVTHDERYEFIKLYDILRDMDFELTELQESVFDKFLEN